jgi:parallel beta-helix repeat protein
VVEDTYYQGIYANGFKTTVTGNLVRNIFDDDCYYISTNGGAISNNRAEGATYGYGFDLLVYTTTISNNTAEFNTYDGFYISGDENTISKNTARHNGDGNGYGGLDVSGDNNLLSGNLAEMNTGYGFWIYGNNTLTGNTAHTNYRTGIYLASTSGGILLVNANVATNNHGEGIANFATGTCNITNNIALGNRTDICDEGPADLFQGNTFNTGGWNVPCCLE